MKLALHPRVKHRAQRGERAGASRHGSAHISRELIRVLQERRHGRRGYALGPQVHDRRLKPQVIFLDECDRIAHQWVIPQLCQGLVHILILRQVANLRLDGLRGRGDPLARGAGLLREGHRRRTGPAVDDVLVAGLRRDQAYSGTGHRFDPQAAPIAPGPHAAVPHAHERVVDQVRRITEQLRARLHQVAGGLPRGRTRPIDPRAHEELDAPSARHRHVRQAALLALRVHSQGAPVVPLHPLRIRGRGLGLALHVQQERRQIRAVPAQRVRQRARIRQPGSSDRRLIQPRHSLALVVRREDAVTQPEDDDAIPLEALGGVDRHDLHSARIWLPQGCLEPVLALVGHAQVGQERAEGGPRRILLVGRRHRDELVEGRAPAHRQRIGDHVVQRAHDEDRPLDLLGDRAPHALANLPQALAQQPHAAHRLLADRRPPLSRPPRLRRRIHRIQKDRLVGVRPLRAGENARPVAQRHQVGGPQVNARQQARQPRGGLNVISQFQRGAHVLHGGLVKQTAEPHDLRRDTRVTQGSIHVREVLAAPAQHRDRAPLAALARLGAHAAGEVDHGTQRGLVVGGVGDVDMPGPRSVSRDQDGRLGLEVLFALLVRGDLAQGRGHAIRCVQDRLVVAPGGGQGERLALLCLPRLESIQEGLQRRGRGPPPAVNSLIRVAHRGDSVVAEQHGQHVHLDDGRVLELVEEDRAELFAQRLANRRGLAHDARGQDELVGKVQHAHVALALLILRDGVEEGDAAAVRPQQAPCVVVRLAHLFKLAAKAHEGLAGALHRVAVLGDLACQVQDLSDCTQGREILVEVGGPRLDNLQHEVQSPGLGEHREIGVDADTHPVLGHDAFGEGVVGEGHGVLVEALAQLRHLA